MIQSNNKSERNDKWEYMSIVVNHQRQKQPQQNMKADNSSNKACGNMNGKEQGTWIANKKRNGKNRMIN